MDLEEDKVVAKKKILVAASAIALGSLMLTACGDSDDASGSTSGKSDGKIVMGFAQVGAESGWRTANTKSIQASAKEAGIDLKFSDAQQKQENQIKSIRSYIQQKVSVIAFTFCEMNERTALIWFSCFCCASANFRSTPRFFASS